MSASDGKVVSNFIVQALQGRPITIYVEGEQTRSFQYVSDLVEGMVRLMESEEFFSPVNIGNPEGSTIRGLAEKSAETHQFKKRACENAVASG